MLYHAKTPKAYLEELEKDWRKEKLLEVRSMLLKEEYELIEGINYKMLCYDRNGVNIFHLNAQVSYVSLYVGDVSKIEDSKNLLEAFNVGKGCIRIKKSNDLSASQLNVFIEKVIETYKQGGNADC